MTPVQDLSALMSSSITELATSDIYLQPVPGAHCFKSGSKIQIQTGLLHSSVTLKVPWSLETLPEPCSPKTLSVPHSRDLNSTTLSQDFISTTLSRDFASAKVSWDFARAVLASNLVSTTLFQDRVSSDSLWGPFEEFPQTDPLEPLNLTSDSVMSFVFEIFFPYVWRFPVSFSIIPLTKAIVWAYFLLLRGPSATLLHILSLCAPILLPSRNKYWKKLIKKNEAKVLSLPSQKSFGWSWENIPIHGQNSTWPLFGECNMQ